MLVLSEYIRPQSPPTFVDVLFVHIEALREVLEHVHGYIVFVALPPPALANAG